jgi:ABC-2 type transport system permease protein
MNKMWIVIKREYAQVVKKKSFLIGIILTPLFMAFVTIVPMLLATKKSDTTENIAIIDLDRQGIGERFKQELAEYKLKDERPAYKVTDVFNIDPADSTEFTGRRKYLDSLINSGDLKSYIIVKDNIVESDSAILVAKSFAFSTINRFEYRMRNILAEKRLEKMAISVGIDSILDATRGIEFKQQAPGGKERDFLTMYLSSIIFIMIIFMTALGYGQTLMRSVIEEKNSRIIEVLVSSISPFQLMAGKVIGLGLASLTQVAIWFVMGLGLWSFRSSLAISSDVAGVIFNPVFLVFFIIYLILGYLLYSTLFALIGSIVNSDKEAQNFIFPITMSMLLPVMIAMYIVQEPDATVAVVLSLIPLFTPTMMVLRLNFTGVESFSLANPMVVQAIIGVILTFLATVGVIWITGKIFRVGILMYGKRPTLPEIIKWVKH